MMLNETSAQIDIDLDRDGRQDGAIRVPWSTEDVPFGWIETPITSIRNGSGPCVLLIGGCHGDEYEGQIVLRRLLVTVSLPDVRGQLIVLPAANIGAVTAGRRISPHDGGNLNRAFPGQSRGTPTAVIAYIINTVLLPRVTLAIDLHSGGRSVAYAPATMLTQLSDPGRMAEQIGLAKIFGLPLAFMVDREDDAPASILGACAAANVLNISAEIGGGASVSVSGLLAAEMAVKRLLTHFGSLSGAPTDPAPEVRIFRRLPIRNMITAPISGLFEPCIEPGSDVSKGDVVGRMYDLENAATAPTDVASPCDGVVLCRRVQVMTPKGAGLFKLGVPWP
jgi:uncharacterized protein